MTPVKIHAKKEIKISNSNAEIMTFVLHPIKHVLKCKPCGKHPLRLVKQEKPLARSHLNLFERVGNQQSTPRAHFHPGDLKFYPAQSPPSLLKTRLRRQQCSPHGSHLLSLESWHKLSFLDGDTRSLGGMTCSSSHLDIKCKQQKPGKSERLAD